MLSAVYQLIVSEKDFLSALASIATVFAVLVPLPAYVISTIIQRSKEARERAFSLISRVDSGELRSLRDRTLRIREQHRIATADKFDELTNEEAADLRQFMNEQEVIGLHLNSSRADRDVFHGFWRASYIEDWEQFKNYVRYLRSTYGPHLYTEWEKAAEFAKLKSPKWFQFWRSQRRW